LLAFLSLILVFGVFEGWVRWAPLIFLGRFLILLGLNVSSASLLSNLRVRDMARETGLGSLIYSGRGLGAIFGFLVTLWELWNTKWEPASNVSWQNPAGLAKLTLLQPGGSFVPFALTAAILALSLTFVMLLTLRGAGHLTQRYWRGFGSGFYATFLFWCILLSLLTAIPLTYGILQVEIAATGAPWV
jgi:hypothetical protein